MTVLEEPVSHKASKDEVTVKTYCPQDKAFWDVLSMALRMGFFCSTGTTWSTIKTDSKTIPCYSSKTTTSRDLPANLAGDTVQSHGA
jgi:hypothetical protein